jgi:hypothetical protein
VAERQNQKAQRDKQTANGLALYKLLIGAARAANAAVAAAGKSPKKTARFCE